MDAAGLTVTGDKPSPLPPDHTVAKDGRAYLLRPARAEDHAIIRALVRRARLDPLNLHWQNFIVAASGSLIIGVCQVKPYLGARELGSLVVQKDWRKQGVGSALIKALLAQEKGGLFLLCRQELESYYAQFGFVRVGWKETRGMVRLKYMMGRVIVQLLAGRRLVVMHWGNKPH